MSAELLARLIAAGTPPELIAEVAMLAARAEKAEQADPVAERRRAWDREYRAERRAREKAALSGGSGGCRVDNADNADTAPTLDKESVPQTPLKEINPTRGVCDTRAHEDAIGVPVSAKLAANRIALAVLARLIADARELHTVSTAVLIWNAMAKRTGLATVKAMTEERRKRLRARLAEHGPDAFTEAIDAIERSPFCLGDSRGGWRADFDFLLQPSSFTKLIEGSYDRASGNRSARSASGREDPIFAARRNLGRDHEPRMGSAAR